MKAVVLQDVEVLGVSSVAEPVEGDDAIVEVEWCGICGTDRHVFLGEYGDRRVPRVLGHEAAGRVVLDPSGRLASGTQVALDINVTCGACAHCRRGSTMTCAHLQQVGVHRDGAFARYVAVPPSHLTVLPDGMSTREGALFEPLACVIHAQSKLRWDLGLDVVVLGAGPTGILHAQLAHARTGRPVVVVDLDEERLEVAAAHRGVVATRADRLLPERATSFDVVVDAAGSAASADMLLPLVRSSGQVLCFGIPAPHVVARIPPHEMVSRELSVVGSNGATPAAWASIGQIAASGVVRFDLLPSTEVDLEGAVARINGQATQAARGKVLVNVGDSV
jgi:2-desacetyl-2-hydroxyethyl bacteriochlorophyllide A dehydrogenase